MTPLEILQGIPDRFNYTTYLEVCKANNIPPRPISIWAQVTGIMAAAEAMFPDDPIEVAQEKFSAECKKVVIQNTTAPSIKADTTNAQTSQSTQSCCGGGKVL